MMNVLLAGAGCVALSASPDGEPAVMMWHPSAATVLRERALAGDASVKDAVREQVLRAEKLMGVGPFSVTHKTFVPPSGDLHDFSTIGRYWWPNPDTPDGLPWVRRDGETNPQYFDPDFGDTQRFLDLWRAAVTLSRAYWVTDDEKYAAKAADLLRAWFIDPDTRMNPHAKYAARFPGRWDGKSWGIHGTRQLALVCDAVGLLERSETWTDSDQAAMRAWMSDYLDWLLTSENGIEEGATINNHATAYDWLVMRLAVFVGRGDVATRVAEDFKHRRIAAQIEPDGSMPAELARATPWRYAGYALEYLFASAILADRLGVDLWHFETDDGRSVRAALDYIVGRIEPEPEHIDAEILEDIGVDRIGPLLAVAAKVYDEARYGELMQRIGWDDALDPGATTPDARLGVTLTPSPLGRGPG